MSASGIDRHAPNTAGHGSADQRPAPAGGDAVIEAAGVWFSYDMHPVLRDATFRIESGDFVSLVGPNGGGKTTLLRLMLGLLEPRSGEMRVFGRPPASVRKRIGYMPQHVNLDARFPVTVMDVVLTGTLGRGRNFGAYGGLRRVAAERALLDVEMFDLRNRPFASLSGGQRQRTLIARALAGDPELLLLDEPTASLDPGVQDDLYELLHRLNQRMTVLLVSHDISVVSQHVNKVICVNIDVAVHLSSAIKGELARLYDYGDGVRLVRHDHRI